MQVLWPEPRNKPVLSASTRNHDFYDPDGLTITISSILKFVHGLPKIFHNLTLVDTVFDSLFDMQVLVV